MTFYEVSPRRQDPFNDTRPLTGPIAEYPRAVSALSHVSLRQRGPNGKSSVNRSRSAAAKPHTDSRRKGPLAQTNIPGLFVTLVQNSPENQLFNLTRDVDLLKQQIAQDAYQHQAAMGAQLRENMILREENAKLRTQLARTAEDHDREVRELRVLKECYEGKYRGELEKVQETQLQMKKSEEEKEALRVQLGSKVYQLQEAEEKAKRQQELLSRCEAQVMDHANRLQTQCDENLLLKKKCSDMEAEKRDLLGQIQTQGRIIAGLESELKSAQEKISSIAFFRDVFTHAAKRSQHSAGASHVGGGAPVADSSASPVRERLYRKYFGRIEAAAPKHPAASSARHVSPQK